MQFRNTKQKSMIFSTIHKYGHLTVEQIKELLEKGKKKGLLTQYD